MGKNEEKYSDIVADVAETNASNMTESSNEGAKNSVLSLQSISDAA